MGILKKCCQIFLIFLIFLIGIPLIMNMGIGVIHGNGSNDGWLGFWGGYLGSIVAVFFTVAFTIRYSNKQLEINRDSQIQAHIKIKQYEKLIDYEAELENFYELLSDCENVLIRSDESLKEKSDIINKIKREYSKLKIKYEMYFRFVGKKRASKIRKIHNSIVETWPEFEHCIENDQIYPQFNINKSIKEKFPTPEISVKHLEISVKYYKEKVLKDCLLKVIEEHNDSIEGNLK